VTFIKNIVQHPFQKLGFEWLFGSYRSEKLRPVNVFRSDSQWITQSCDCRFAQNRGNLGMLPAEMAEQFYFITVEFRT
jgi:hypothetical protein